MEWSSVDQVPVSDRRRDQRVLLRIPCRGASTMNRVKRGQVSGGSVVIWSRKTRRSEIRQGRIHETEDEKLTVC